nr:YopX family protein [uncultured Schaedlerella sp.]
MSIREILFRGKQTDYKNWIEGSLVYINNGDDVICQIADSLLSKDKDGSVLVIAHAVDPETICQFTGFIDLYGNKVFEGDIIQYHFDDSIIGIVRYGEYQNTFCDDEHAAHVGFYVEWQERKDRLRKDLGYWLKQSKVSGNIFDDTELMDKTSEYSKKKGEQLWHK